MTQSTLLRTAALGAVLALAPNIALAADSFWKGTWTGAWGGRTPTSITIGNDSVKKYVYDGEKRNVGQSKVAKTVRFGTDYYVIVIRRTGKDTAHATYDDDEGLHGTVDLVRR